MYCKFLRITKIQILLPAYLWCIRFERRISVWFSVVAKTGSQNVRYPAAQKYFYLTCVWDSNSVRPLCNAVIPNYATVAQPNRVRRYQSARCVATRQTGYSKHRQKFQRQRPQILIRYDLQLLGLVGQGHRCRLQLRQKRCCQRHDRRGAEMTRRNLH